MSGSVESKRALDAWRSAPIGLFLLDGAGMLVEGNHRFIELVGPAAVPGPFAALVDGDERDPIARALAAAGDEPFVREFQVRLSPDRSRWVRCRIVPIDPTRHDAGRIGVLEDIEERKLADAQLQKAIEDAVAASRLKDQFLANMSHEIRSPLGAITGMAELLSDSPLNQEQRRYVEILQNANDHLLAVINDVLDLSKIEAGHMSLDKVDFNLRELVEKSVELMMARSRAKGLELISHVVPEAPSSLVGDPHRLRQVLVNLLSNAVKFTDAGRIVLQVEKGPEADSLLFSVADTGPGIPADKLEVIFDSFTQVDASITRRHGGTGLGLAISRRLVEAMEGRLWAESRPGEGSTFRFTARFAHAAHSTARSSSTWVDLNGVRALVMASDATNRLVLREMLSGWGATVIEAAVSDDGLWQVAQAAGASHPVRLVVIDDHELDSDGVELCEKLRAHEPRPEVVLIRIEATPAIAARCRELQVVGPLVKPVRRRALQDAIRQAMPETSSSSAATPVQRAAKFRLRPSRLLVVDDAEENRLMLRAFLSDQPIECRFAENGLAAVEAVRAQPFDLVLMDVQMPILDGHSATREIRRWERERSARPIPIIALTAHAMREHIEKSLAAGCNSHLTKPIKRDLLLAALQQFLPPLEEPTLPVGPIKVVIDPLLVELVPTFLLGRKKDLVALAAAVRERDFESIFAIGHTMNGLGGGYGFQFVTEIGAALETAARTNDAAAVSRLCADLERYFAKVEIVNG